MSRKAVYGNMKQNQRDFFLAVLLVEYYFNWGSADEICFGARDIIKNTTATYLYT